MRRYYRPILSEGEGLPLAGGPFAFARAEVLTRAGHEGFIASADLPDDWRDHLTRPRPLPARLGQVAPLPLIMGVLNITPDSFSDGGRNAAPAIAIAAAHAMHAAGLEPVPDDLHSAGKLALGGAGGEARAPGGGEALTDALLPPELPSARAPAVQ